METGRGDKMGLGHPQLRRLLVHLLRKGGIVPCQFHCRSAGGIVSGRQEHPVAQRTLSHDVALDQPHRRAFHVNGIRIHGKFRVQIAAFQTEQRGHDLGRTRHGTLFLRLFLIEDLSGHSLH